MTRTRVNQRTDVLVILLIFTLTFFSCSTARRVPSSVADIGYFKTAEPTDNKTFVLMKDSSILEGNKSFSPEGLLSKKVVRLDGKPIPRDEVLGFQNKGHYYTKVNNGFARRCLSGRISVYRESVLGPGGSNATAFYFQKDDGPMGYVNVDKLKLMVRDCPKAYDMINISVAEHNKILKKQPYFVQAVIETYNSCDEWK